jgi:hypothetical protein
VYSIMGMTAFVTVSANDFPMQILLPPKNGEKLYGCLLVPLGV